MFKRIISWLEFLTREIPPPKSKQASVNLIQPKLTPAEQAIIAQAEQTLRQTEAQAIRSSEVPEVPEVSEIPTAPEVSEVPTAHISEVPEVPARATVPIAAEETTPTGWASIEAGEEQTPAKVDRKSLVEALLDEACQQGLTTYAQLIDYVKSKTGKGCSKRVIADWKKSREAVAA
jgi:hypothetical protein